MKYRVNYTNGQVSQSFKSKKEAMKHRAEDTTYGHLMWIDFYEAVSGEWFPCGRQS